MSKGVHDYGDDPRNKDIFIYINGNLVPRADAVVSVFDSGFLCGDGVWEGLRVHKGRIAFLHQHLDRLYQGAKAIDLDIVLTPQALADELYRTLEANTMDSSVHLRLMVTRGLKSTPCQDPRFNVGGPTIVIIPEYKSQASEAVHKGIRLFTVHVRSGSPDVQHSKLNTHSGLDCVTACIQAIKAGTDEALMLDPHGFVATCNSTHFFVVRENEVWTSSGKYSLDGITRRNVIRLCADYNIPVFEKDFSLAKVYSAREAFVTSTLTGIVPVREVDGRVIGGGGRGNVTQRLQELYRELIERECSPGG